VIWVGGRRGRWLALRAGGAVRQSGGGCASHYCAAPARRRGRAYSAHLHLRATLVFISVSALSSVARVYCVKCEKVINYEGSRFVRDCAPRWGMGHGHGGARRARRGAKVKAWPIVGPYRQRDGVDLGESTGRTSRYASAGGGASRSRLTLASASPRASALRTPRRTSPPPAPPAMAASSRMCGMRPRTFALACAF